MQQISEQEDRSSQGSGNRVSLQRTDQTGERDREAAVTPAAAAGSIAQQHPDLADVTVLLLQLLLSVQQAEQLLAHDDATTLQQHEFDMQGVSEAIRAAAVYSQEKLQQHGLGTPVLYLWQPVNVAEVGDQPAGGCRFWNR
jgi:hypothetical protein